MNNLPSELLIVGGLLLLGLAVVIVARYAKQILAFLLIVAGVAIVALIAWAVLQRPDVIPDDTAETIHDLGDIARILKPESEPAQPAPAPQPTYTAPAPSGSGFCAGVLVALLIVALGVGGYFGLRWKLAERGGISPTKRKQRKAKDPMPVVYIVEGPADELGEWGLEELSEWDTSDYFQS